MIVYALKLNNRYMFTIPLKNLIEIKNIEFFEPNDKRSIGYQRKIEQLHLKKLKSYIKSKQGNISFPTPIILGADDGLRIVENINNDVPNLVEIHFNINQTVNIVDGQHRLEAMISLIPEFPHIQDLEVMCVLSTSMSRTEEIKTFIDINSKAKKIKPDLAMLALDRHNYLNNENDDNGIVKYISIKVAYLMNNDRKSVWHNAIKFNFNEDDVEGIVSVSSFVDSLDIFIKAYFKKHNKDLSIDSAEEVSEELSDLINDCWLVVKNKWPECFNKEKIEDSEIFYNIKYEIQLYSGFWAINSLIKEAYKYSIDKDSSFEEYFRKIINNSPLSISDWKRGGLISGRTSQAAIKKSMYDILSSEDRILLIK
jgi:DGQHR domain-containing protein